MVAQVPMISFTSRRFRSLLVGPLLAALGACAGTLEPVPVPAPNGLQTLPDTVRIPLIDMGTRTYRGFRGGLYPDGGNAPPEQHATAGLEAARRIRPLDADGNPSPTGRYVLLSIGMSNTTQEFCSQNARLPCDPWTFMGRAASDPAVNNTTLAIVNGARGAQSADRWDAAHDPEFANYDRVRDSVLVPQGLTERQVQIAWVKVANPRPTVALPAPGADAYTMVKQMGDIVRAMKIRYPNLRQVFFSSRIYAGYATSPLNPEPYAYESGLAVKWLIEAQIEQMRAGGGITDVRGGDLDYSRGLPWIAWGPYLWADGVNVRSDGLAWEPADFAGDGTHPATSGRSKVGAILQAFFKTSPFTRCWFVAGETC